MIASLFLSALLAAPPELLPGDGPLLTEADYPAEARYRDQDGRVGVMLEIDATGKVRGCTVTETSGVSALDARTCQLLPQRLRYRPATDTAGNPVPSRLATAVRWALEPRNSVMVDLGPGGESGVIAHYKLAKGAITECHQETIGTPPSGVFNMCEMIPDAQVLKGLFADRLTNLDAFEGRILFRSQVADAVAAAAARDAGFTIRRLMFAADFSVAPSGKVLGCTPVAGMVAPGNGCSVYKDGDLKFPPWPEAQGALNVRLTVDFVASPQP